MAKTLTQITPKAFQEGQGRSAVNIVYSSAQSPIPPTVAPSRFGRRQILIVATFLLLVVAPIVVSAGYLWLRAADQYSSTVGFGIRHAGADSSVGFGALSALSGLSQLSGSTHDDAQILKSFLHSQEIVQHVQDQIDLKAIWSLKFEDDPAFAFDPQGAIEDLHKHWQSNVKIAVSASAGLIEVTAYAFDPQSAFAISSAILAIASSKINALSAIAHEDSIRFAKWELLEAESALLAARDAVTRFREQTKIVDPHSSLQSQMGLLSNLQTKLAEVLIQRDLLIETTQTGDPRLVRMTKQIEAIEVRINDELKRLGLGTESPGEASR